jgi:prolipoprotein diacylglyceryltransferase
MRQVLFRWGEIRIYSYPCMLYVGIVLGVIAGTYAGACHGMNRALTCGAMLVLVIPALVGARALYVISHWELYRGHLGRVCSRSEGERRCMVV